MRTYSASIQGKRESNEDTHVYLNNLNSSNSLSNPINLLAVFDGHGGKTISNYLKTKLPVFFTHKIQYNVYNNSELAIKYFNDIFNILQKNMEKEHPRVVKRCGSTACICIHFIDFNNKHKLWVLNVGDSRAVKCNYLDIAIPLTIDHKPNQPHERERIEKLGGTIRFDGSDWRIKDLSLSRAFGDCDAKPFVCHHPQIYKYNIDPKDKFIIIACDGLWDILSNQDAIDFINKLLMRKSFKGNYAKLLVDYAYQQGSTDNITALVYIL
jgi:serine/threonine protein phosphatase PrpC